MSKIRGQGRLLVLIGAGVLVIFVLYNYMSRSAVSTGTRSVKDRTVREYHKLAGQLDLGADDAWNRRARPKNTFREMIKESAPRGVKEMEHPAVLQPPVGVNPRVPGEDDDGPEDEGRDEEEGEEEETEMEELRKKAQLQKPPDQELPVIPTAKPGKKKFSAFVSKTEPEPFPLYTDPNPKYTSFFADKMRLVHLDLKGAPPKMSYLAKLLPLFSKMGATGLLVEYEDTFPYSQQLSVLSAKYAYTKEDIGQINKLAQQNELEIIPLVQTFGHMEFVLKGRAYQTLREQDETPQIISPRYPASMVVIKAMIEQVKALHPNSKYFHIGCDEVYQLGKGKSKTLMEDNKWNATSQLFFYHVKNVVKVVRDLHLLPIMWDDMFRKLNESHLQESGLGDLVEPMIWQYATQPQRHLPVDIWPKYGKVFKNVWVASSFKGATGSSQYITDASIHLENHLNWVEIMKQYGGNPASQYVTFRGTVLTGWQRYDHFATLCELLPMALPSLAVCLQTMQHGYFNEELHKQTSQALLQCERTVELRLHVEPDGSDCKFPGSNAYYGVQTLYKLHHLWDHYSIHHRLSGWMSSYNMRYNFSSPGQMGVILTKLNDVRIQLIDLRQNMSNFLSDLFDQSAVAEFLDVQIDEFVREADRNIIKAKSLAARRTWPQRPLINNKEEEPEDAKNPQLKLAGGGEEAANPKSKENKMAKLKNIDPNMVDKPVALPQPGVGQVQVIDVLNIKQQEKYEQKISPGETEQFIQQRNVGQEIFPVETERFIKQKDNGQKLSPMGTGQLVQERKGQRISPIEREQLILERTDGHDVPVAGEGNNYQPNRMNNAETGLEMQPHQAGNNLHVPGAHRQLPQHQPLQHIQQQVEGRHLPQRASVINRLPPGIEAGFGQHGPEDLLKTGQLDGPIRSRETIVKFGKDRNKNEI